jgi:hypothetical protein
MFFAVADKEKSSALGFVKVAPIKRIEYPTIIICYT